MKSQISFFLFLFIALQLNAQQKPKLVMDINDHNATSFPDNFVVVGENLFFLASDGLSGIELWKTDGSLNSAELVADIVPGNMSSNPKNLVAFYNKLLFNADGNKLWITDGTSAGTRIIDSNFTIATNGVFANGFYFFAHNNGISGTELWRTDGTSAGTILVKDIQTGSSSSNPANMVVVGDTVYFSATDSLGTELWRSEGDLANTLLVMDIYPGSKSSMPTWLVAYNGAVFFSAIDENNGRELWMTRGTRNSTKMLKNIAPGSASSSPEYLVGNTKGVFFSANDGVHGKELWKSNGDFISTVMVRDLDTWQDYGSTPRNLVATKNYVYFIAVVDNGQELYFSDGTWINTRLTRDLYPIQTDAQITELIIVGDSVFFIAHSSPDYGNFELHISGGSYSSTHLVKDINGTDAKSNLKNLTSFKGKCFFTADDGKTGIEPWVSDGTSIGTKLFKDINAGTYGSSISSVVAFNNGVVFNPTTDNYGRELWITKGSEKSTEIIKDVASGTKSSSPTYITAAGDIVYYYVPGSAAYGELYYTDGTALGTKYHLLTSYVDYLSNLTAMGNQLLFARRSSFNNEIWSFENGSAKLLRKINPNGLGADVADFVLLNDSLMFFTADDGNDHGRELWKTDGTYTGTVIVKDIWPDYFDSNPRNLTASGGKLYFLANDGKNGNELWITDGNGANTYMVKDLNPAGSVAISVMFGDGKGNLYFSMDDATYGRELWFTDGTANGVKLLMDINQGNSGSDIKFLGNNDGLTYFSADNGTNGHELWVTDGTTSSTKMIKDINEGDGSSYVSSFTVIPNGKMYFSANDGIHGVELWESDGTTKGTKLVYDLLGGIANSSPTNFAFYNDTLFFVATSYEFGSELFYIYTKCLAPAFSSKESCPGDSVTFVNQSDSFGMDSISYSWSINGGPLIKKFETNYKFNLPGEYTVKLIMTAPGCVAEKIQTHKVNKIPEPNFEIEDDTICFRGNKFKFINNTTDPDNNLEYEWRFSDGDKLDTKQASKAFMKVGDYQVVLAASYKGCEGTTAKSIFVAPHNEITTIVGNNVVKSKIDSFSVAYNVGSSYKWNINNGTQIGGGNTNKAIVEWNEKFNKGRVSVIEINKFGCESLEASKQVDLNITSIDNLQISVLHLYPNPAKDHILIDFDGANSTYSICIFDNLGQLVYNQNDKSVDGNTPITISTNQLPMGVYQVVLRNNDAKYNGSFVITR